MYNKWWLWRMEELSYRRWLKNKEMKKESDNNNITLNNK